MGVEALHHAGEVAAGEAPIERSGGLVVAVLEPFEAIPEDGQVSEVGWFDDFALDDREHVLVATRICPLVANRSVVEVNALRDES